MKPKPWMASGGVPSCSPNHHNVFLWVHSRRNRVVASGGKPLRTRVTEERGRKYRRVKRVKRPLQMPQTSAKKQIRDAKRLQVSVLPHPCAPYPSVQACANLRRSRLDRVTGATTGHPDYVDESDGGSWACEPLCTNCTPLTGVFFVATEHAAPTAVVHTDWRRLTSHHAELRPCAARKRCCQCRAPGSNRGACRTHQGELRRLL